MVVPFGESPASGDGKSGFRRCCLQCFGLPAVERALHGLLIVRAIQERQQAAAMMRQVGVQPCPASVAAAIKAGEIVVIFLVGFAVELQIAFAAKLDGCVTHVDADMLPASGALPPQFVGCQCRSCNGRLRPGADCERGGQRRLAAGEADTAQRGSDRSPAVCISPASAAVGIGNGIGCSIHLHVGIVDDCACSPRSPCAGSRHSRRRIRRQEKNRGWHISP